jgi:acyl-CoA thioesterase
MAETTLPGVAHPILKNDHASEWMGIEVLRLGPGHATIRMRLRQEMLNGFGMAHGGMIFAFADSAFALACNPVKPPASESHKITVASGVDINFLKPAYQGQIITAVANRRAHTGRSGLYDIQIYAADTVQNPDDNETPGELIAEFRGRSRTISRK